MPVELIKVCFAAGLLRLAGLTPVAITDTEGSAWAGTDLIFEVR